MFISHAGPDKWVAKQIERHLLECGAETFLDDTSIPHGEDIEDHIIDALNKASEIVVLLTPWAISSPYIWLELGPFFAARKRVIGAVYGIDIESIGSDKRMPIFFKRIKLLALDDIETYFQDVRSRTAGRETSDG